MTAHGNGQPTLYQVTQLGPVPQAIKDQYARAQLDGNGQKFLKAMRHVYQRLRQNPHSFGEPKYPLHAMHMIVYLGMHDQLVVEFGIHETEPLVVVRSVKYLDKS